MTTFLIIVITAIISSLITRYYPVVRFNLRGNKVKRQSQLKVFVKARASYERYKCFTNEMDLTYSEFLSKFNGQPTLIVKR